MKKIIIALFLLAAALPFTFAAAKDADKPAAEEVVPLRKNPIDGPEDPSVNPDWKTKDTPVPRTFIHQPPVIPHDIKRFTITTTQNDCIRCHGAEGSGARRPFKTHYLDRDGKVTETVSPRWYFCTQCHVGQADAPPLVENSFDAAAQGKK